MDKRIAHNLGESGMNDHHKYQREINCRLEVNIAFMEIESAFSELPHQPVHVSRKQQNNIDYIELTFITPRIGEYYRDVIQDLQEWILWDIKLRDTSHEKLILDTVRSSLPSGCNIVKGPGFNKDKYEIRLTVSGLIPTEILDSWKQHIVERTGCHLMVTLYQ